MNQVSNALTIQNLNYFYVDEWTRKKKQVVKDLSLTINSGELFGFLGHNGAGKTTTIKAILGLTRPHSGSIEIAGKPSKDPEARKEVGYLPEQPYFYDNLSVKELMEFYATLAGVNSSDKAKRIDSALEKVQLKDRVRTKMRALSKGLMQRVAMAQAIVANPKLLILDEPFSGLDPVGRKEFRELLLDLKKQGTTIFMSSHILSDVEYLCDRASIMVRGELKGVYDLRKGEHRRGESSFELVVKHGSKLGTEATSLAKKVTKEEMCTRLDFKDRSSAEKVLLVAVQSQAEVISFAPTYPSLEELFMQLLQDTKA